MAEHTRTIIVAGGGTGGHLFPGIAVADELRRRDAGTRVVFVGTPKGLEGKLVPRAGYELVLLPILPLNAVGLARAVKGALVLPWGLLKAALVVRRLRAEAVLGVGGYAAGPVTLAAALMGVRAVILEPNARPGFTNRVLRPFVRYAACSYPEAQKEFGAKGVLTGNPVRGGFATLPRRAHVPPFSLLVFGGSQGSRVLNRAVVDALPRLPGATTCAELAAAGKASVLVPFAAAADDHQRQNAAAMQSAGAAVMVEEKELSGDRLAAAVSGVLQDPGSLERMEDAARKLGRPDAAARVADLLEGRA